MFNSLTTIAILLAGAAVVLPAPPAPAESALLRFFARRGRSLSPARAPWPRPTMRSQHWTVRYALVAYVTLCVSAVAVALVLGFAGVSAPVGVGVLIVEAIMLSTLFPLYRSGSLRAIDLGLRRVPGARSVGLVLLGLFVYVLLSVLWMSLVHLPPVRSTFDRIAHQSTIVIVLTGFAVAVGAPVVEEIFFRGFLYRSLRNRLSIAPASLIAGAMFALVHTQYSLLERPEQLIFGVIAALLYERTGSLLPGIAMHSFIDATGFELALTGNDAVVSAVFGLLAIVLLARPPLKRVARHLSSEPSRFTGNLGS
jgi:membrane protease YdiL (CAAX protease family)